MTECDPLVWALRDARRRFLELVAEARPDLHRYCARMTGSVADGQDLVKETLARGYYSLAEVEKLPPLHDGEHLDQTYSTFFRRFHPFITTPTASITRRSAAERTTDGTATNNSARN
jgi:hypothetical protein